MALYSQAEENENMDTLKGTEGGTWGLFGRLGVVLVADGTTED